MEQDNHRELYTFDSANKDLMKLPTFEGKEYEDYADFKEKAEKAFAHNRVSRADKLDKLRSCLRGQAKKLVPISLTGDVDKAWEVLNKAFGDPVILMASKKDALKKLGPMPKENAKGGHNAIATWYLEVESKLKEILDLGRTSTKLGMEAFSPTAFEGYLKMFSSGVSKKLNKRPGEFDKKLESMIEKISELRSEEQEQDRIYGNSHSAGSSGGSNPNSGGGGGSNSTRVQYGNGSTQKSGFEMPNLWMYDPPKRDVNCRICKTLENTGDTIQLYDNHVNSYPTGCPRYIGFSITERNAIARKAKFCLKCHDPNYIFQHKDTDHKCIINRKKKSKYTCSNDSCTVHMWV